VPGAVGPGLDAETGVLLIQEFNAATLRFLREAVVAHASAAGLSEERAVDVMLAVHELAANAVRHGAGSGRLRMEVTSGQLRCQISDAGANGRDAGPHGRAVPGASGAPWPVQPGHGLWVTRNTADQVAITVGPGGSVVTVVFCLG
jgi:anti-sigma regulatory factor (Ser/Thr protein kinase)